MAELDADARNDLKDSQFAVPERRALPIHDPEHVRAALSRFSQTKFASDVEKKTAAAKIRAAAQKFGIDVSEDALQMADLSSIHNDRAVKNMSVAYSQPGGSMKHTHAKAGGGTETHSHADASAGHGHEGLLPLPKHNGNMSEGAEELDMAWGDAARAAALASRRSHSRQRSRSSHRSRRSGHGRHAAPSSHPYQRPHPPTADELKDIALANAYNIAGEAVPALHDFANKNGLDVTKLTDAQVTQAINAAGGSLPPGGYSSAGAPKKFAEHNLSKDGAVLRLAFADPIEAGEKRVPFLRALTAEFDDYGPFEVTRQDLTVVKDLFDQHARRQDIPVMLGVEAFGEANEDHHMHDDALIGGGRAVGWLKSLELDPEDPDRLDAVVDLNPVGEKLLANDQYRYVSPELLRNWKDPEKGVIYPLVATGLAFTNKPRLKSLGPFAAAEDSTGVSVMAFSEGPAAAESPREAVRLLMADMDQWDGEPDNDGDDDGPVPPCVYQPPYSPLGCCPGFTRRPSDQDGDGTCVFAELGCNGYRAIFDTAPTMPTASIGFSEGNKGGSMPDTEPTAPAPSAEPTPTPPVNPAPVPEPAPAPEPAPSVTPPVQAPPTEPATSTATEAANLSETNAILAAERSRADRLEAEVARLSEANRSAQAAQKLATFNDRVDRLVRDGKVTPAERDRLGEQIVLLSEGGPAVDSLFAILENRQPVIQFSEVGSGATETASNDSSRLHQAALALLSERNQTQRTPGAYRQALLDAARGVR